MNMDRPVGEEEVMEMNAALAQNKTFTTDYLDELPEEIRAEVIDGQIFYMAAPYVIHQKLVSELHFVSKKHVKDQDGACEVLVSPVGVRLNSDKRTEVQPDIIVVCDKEKLKPEACYGAPDLIIEIASKSTQSRDYGMKMLKYRTAGVKEYWIVDPKKRTVMVYWFEDENQNCLYDFEDEIAFHLFSEVKVRIADWV